MLGEKNSAGHCGAGDGLGNVWLGLLNIFSCCGTGVQWLGFGNIFVGMGIFFVGVPSLMAVWCRVDLVVWFGKGVIAVQNG